MANPFYQPSVPRPAARTDRAGAAPAFAAEVIRRFVSFARALRLPDLRRRRRDCARSGAGQQGSCGRDVLWRAKCNALHRSLADHDLTNDHARILLCRLSAARGHGSELVRLGSLTGVDACVLDRAVPLLGLQNFISVHETTPGGCSGPVLWVAATEHGLRYAAETLEACGTASQGPS